jgi:hypothetical protein
MFVPARLRQDEEKTAANAVGWAACAFRGSCRFERVETSSLEEALTAAPTLYQDRPVMIYANDAGGRFAMLGSWRPDR